MIRTPRPGSAILAAALLTTLSLASPRAEAQVKPFKVTGGGVADFLPVTVGVPSSHFAIGQATELGRYYGEGAFQVDRFISGSTALFSSAEPFVFTAANGDQLAFTYGDTNNGAAQPGRVQLYPTAGGLVIAVYVAEFNLIPELSTGRFSRAVDGSFIMTATTEPFVLGGTDPVPYTWEGEGWLAYAPGGRR